jgi:NDP-sugar pyrophosphorylase family protein
MAALAVLLAGGSSLRMGRDKSALEIRGETLVERHLRQLRGIGVTEALIVCNAANREAFGRRTGARTVLQIGEGMSSAVRTGLQAIGPATGVWIVCVNDIILDSDYAKIAAADGEGITIPTRMLDRVFHGGHLLLEQDRVRAIIEKPPGGCPIGAHANIMVHRVSGRRALPTLAAATGYEDALNELMAKGLPARAVAVDFWIAVKTPEDFERVNRSLGAAR